PQARGLDHLALRDTRSVEFPAVLGPKLAQHVLLKCGRIARLGDVHGPNSQPNLERTFEKLKREAHLSGADLRRVAMSISYVAKRWESRMSRRFLRTVPSRRPLASSFSTSFARCIRTSSVMVMPMPSLFGKSFLALMRQLRLNASWRKPHNSRQFESPNLKTSPDTADHPRTPRHPRYRSCTKSPPSRVPYRRKCHASARRCRRPTDFSRRFAGAPGPEPENGHPGRKRCEKSDRCRECPESDGPETPCGCALRTSCIRTCRGNRRP